MKVSMVGDIVQNMMEIGAQIAERGPDVDMTVPTPGAAVIFCVSAVDGASEETLEDVLAWENVEAGPVGIVMSKVDEVEDPELLDLVALEFKELLARIMPTRTAKALPVWHSCDAGWVDECLARVEDVETIVLKSGGGKPWWRFW